jgi:DNA-binding GntR family transcriptional regulator
MSLPPTARSLDKPLLSERVYEELRGWIVSGELAPGEVLRDGELAEHLGVSRTPVREAIRRLVDNGLLEASANRWTRVAEIRPEDVDHLLPIVRSLEVLALELALPRLEPDGLREMEEANGRLEQAVAAGDHVAAAEANRAFHNAFLSRAGNPELEHLLLTVTLKFKRTGVFYFRAVEGAPAESVAEHADLIEAVRGGRPDRMRKALGRHWERVEERLRRAAAQVHAQVHAESSGESQGGGPSKGGRTR